MTPQPPFRGCELWGAPQLVLKTHLLRMLDPHRCCIDGRDGRTVSNVVIVDRFKTKTYYIRALVDASDQSGEASMDATTARQEADKILAELPDRISDVIKPFARQSPDHAALVQDDVTWSYGDLAAI